MIEPTREERRMPVNYKVDFIGGVQCAQDVTVMDLAAAVHTGRFPDGENARGYVPFDNEDRNGREYCLRIARTLKNDFEIRHRAPVVSSDLTADEKLDRARALAQARSHASGNKGGSQ